MKVLVNEKGKIDHIRILRRNIDLQLEDNIIRVDSNCLIKFLTACELWAVFTILISSLRAQLGAL